LIDLLVSWLASWFLAVLLIGWLAVFWFDYLVVLLVLLFGCSGFCLFVCLVGWLFG
jgi:hypothetical protein